jgi:CHAT domain-containing protein/Tfp pilus assembly protein PilF
MRRHLIITILACGLLALIFSQALAQTDDPLAEARRLNDKCLDLLDAGKYDEAIEPCQRALAIHEKALGSEHPAVAISLNNLAEVHRVRGDYAKAELLYRRALAIDEKALGIESLDVASDLNGLAELYRAKGEYAKAEPLYQRALAIREKAHGGEHPEVATVLNNLALLYYSKGDYLRAEPFYQRALAINEKALGGEHRLVATVLNNLAELYKAKGEYVKAEPLLQRALIIDEKALGGEHPDVASDLNNLAGVYLAKDEYAKAEPLYQRALAIYEKTLGGEHPLVANSLNNLATVYYGKGDHAKAEALYQRSLTIREKSFGSEHPEVATVLNNLASLYKSNGDYAKAESLLRRSLAIYEKALGGQHPNVATLLNNLAELYEAKEDYPRALEFQMRGLELSESNTNVILSASSENQKQLYLDTLAGETYGSVSLNVHSMPANAQAARLALTAILRRKGRSLDAMTNQIAALRRRAAPGDIELLDTLAAAQSQLATLQLANDPRLTPAERRTRVTELETEIEKLQGDIGRRNAEFRVRTQPATLDAVRRAIPPDAALVEIFAYQPLDAKAKAISERYGKARYVAYVLKPQWDAPQFADLGDATQIDADLKLWREALLNPDREDVRALGRRVDERVMRPIRKLLGPTKRLFISPDGALNLIPFAALVDENDKYMMETYSLDYLTSGRDLLRLQVRSENRHGAFIFANPTYNLTGQPVAACQRRKPKRGLLLDAEDADDLDEENAAAKRDIAYRGIDFTQLCYPPLRGTAEEATLINAVLPSAIVLTDKRATEAALKELNSPLILHVATHGFFLPDQPQALSANASQGAGASNAENPLLRSGLIMAGANQKSSGAGEDGVLTAAEAAGLNLWGTKLVVLSACETGLGDLVKGAGVYGLRRALVLADSETQVMSLWKVSDAGTRDLMTAYYTRLQKGEGRTEALRQVQLTMLRGQLRSSASSSKRETGDIGETLVPKNYRHPYYWAAFISSGDWRSMKGKEQ